MSTVGERVLSHFINSNQANLSGFANSFPPNVESYDSEQGISKTAIFRLITISVL
jgi:hypothetical protein